MTTEDYERMRTLERAAKAYARSRTNARLGSGADRQRAVDASVEAGLVLLETAARLWGERS